MPGRFSIVMMDAGQGDATLIVAPDDSVILVDCGCKKNTAVVKTEIEAVLKQWLPAAGNRLKALILTHPDGDHYNLLKELVIDAGITVDYVRYGGQADDYAGLSAWLKNKGTGFTQGFHNSNIDPKLSYDGKGTFPNVEIRIIAANAGDPNVKKDANPNSVVLLVTYLDVNVFLMGDATELTEKFIGSQLLKTNLLNNKRNLLKAGHHGSETSSSQDWINLIKPQIVFVSSDTKTFGGTSIPSSVVMDRVKTSGSILNFGSTFMHSYVQYNKGNQCHEQVSTTLGIFSTLHLLKFAPDNIHFTAYGTSWYYYIGTDQQPTIQPAIGWAKINTPS